MQNAVFIQKGQPVPADVDRVYAGHVACPAFLYDTEWLLEITAPLTIVIPPLKPEDMRRFKALAQRLGMAASCDLELSFNDYGALYFSAREGLAQSGVVFCAGLLLAKQDTDPALADYCAGNMQRERIVYTTDGVFRLRYAPPPPELVSHWATPSVQGHISLLRRLGVSRLELCAQPVPFGNFACGLPVTYYANAALVTVAPCAGDGCAGEDCAKCSLNIAPDSGYSQDKNAVWYALQTPPPAETDRIALL